MNFTSPDVNGVPSCHLTPARRRESIGPAVVFDLPPLRELRHRLKLLVEPDETVENLVGDGMGISRRGHRWIQRSRVGPNGHHERHRWR